MDSHLPARCKPVQVGGKMGLPVRQVVGATELIPGMWYKRLVQSYLKRLGVFQFAIFAANVSKQTWHLLGG